MLFKHAYSDSKVSLKRALNLEIVPKAKYSSHIVWKLL